MSLELASAAFVDGYRIACKHGRASDARALVEALMASGHSRSPFAFEGAAMAWRAKDAGEEGCLRIPAFLTEAPLRFRPFIHLGIGCALARLGLPAPEDGTTLNGYGFQIVLSAGVSGFKTASLAEHADRGRGRALWFVTGGDATACGRTIGSSPNAPALWRGVGTACTFAGDPKSHASLLPPLAGAWHDAVAAGSAEALALWRSLGDPPGRALRAASALIPS